MPSLAKIGTEIFSPAIVIIALPLCVAWSATQSFGETLVWGLIVALSTSVLPMAFIIVGARRGKWDGHHVRNREGRLIPLLIILFSSGIGLAVLVLAHGPRQVIALDISMIILLLVSMLVTQWWKVSLHAAAAASAVLVLSLTFSPLLLVLSPWIAFVGWSSTMDPLWPSTNLTLW